MGDEMNFMIKTKNHVADLEIGFLTKSTTKQYNRAIPTAWEFKFFRSELIENFE